MAELLRMYSQENGEFSTHLFTIDDGEGVEIDYRLATHDGKAELCVMTNSGYWYLSCWYKNGRESFPFWEMVNDMCNDRIDTLPVGCLWMLTALLEVSERELAKGNS